MIGDGLTLEVPSIARKRLRLRAGEEVSYLALNEGEDVNEVSAGAAESDQPDEDEYDLDLNATAEQAEALNLSTEERRLVTQPYDLGVRAISDDIKAGRISLTIEYQRKYVWDLGKASRLIESLLLNVPIPVCYFAEDSNGVFEVIDGLQRLSTIKQFLDGKVALAGLSVLTELEGKVFAELAPRDQRRLEGRTIRCIVITEDSHPDIKFDVFERLNTGAASLTAQELRNSVYRGSLNDALKTLAAESYFTPLMGVHGNKRMDYEEIILRYLALVTGESYKPPLRQFLNEYMRTNQNATLPLLEVDRFEGVCRTVSEVLGDSPFRLAGSKTPVNKAFFDAVMVPMAFADRDQVRAKGAEVRAFIEGLSDDDEFRASIGRATADRTRMVSRVNTVADGLADLGVTVALPVHLART